MSGKRNDGGPAFPVADVQMAEPGTIDEGRDMARGGVSLRDYFAAKAMHSAYVHWEGAHPDGFDGLCRFAYQYADAMLKARAS